MKKFCALPFLCTPLLLAVPLFAVEFEVTNRDGTKEMATNPVLTREFLTFEKNGTKIDWPRSELAKITARNDTNASDSHSRLPRVEKSTTKPCLVALNDGSQLVVSDFQLAGEMASYWLLGYFRTEIPPDIIHDIRFAVKNSDEIVTPPTDWVRFLSGAGNSGDQIIVGQTGSLEIYTGILHEINANTVVFELDDEVMPIPRERVFGVILSQKSPLPAKHHSESVVLTLRNGTRLVLQDLTQNGVQQNAGRLSWTTKSGLSGDSEWHAIQEMVFTAKEIPVSKIKSSCIVSIDTMAKESDSLLHAFRKNHYLLAATNTEPLSRFDILAKPTPHRDSENEKSIPPARPLPDFPAQWLDGKMHENSLVLPVGIKIVYDLLLATNEYDLRTESLDTPNESPPLTLKMVAGFDDRVRPFGKAKLTIAADRHLLFEGVISGSESGKMLNFSIPENAEKLSVSVDFEQNAVDFTPLTLGSVTLSPHRND